MEIAEKYLSSKHDRLKTNNPLAGIESIDGKWNTQYGILKLWPDMVLFTDSNITCYFLSFQSVDNVDG